MTEEMQHQEEILRSSSDPDARRRAAERLAERGAEASVAALAAALRDADKGVRDAATRSLVQVGGETVARAVVEYIADDNIGTRNLAAELLKNLGVASIPALLPYLRDASQDVRKFAVDILGLIGARVPAADLLPLLRDPDPNVVLSAVEALGNIGNPAAIKDLCALFEGEAYTRAAVAEALGKIQDPATARFLLAKLREALDASVDPLLLFTIVEALGAVGDADTLAVLVGRRCDLNRKACSALLHAMVRIAERQHLPFPGRPELKNDLLAALGDDDPAIAASAVKGLAGYAGDDVTAALVGALGRDTDMDPLLVQTLAGRPSAFRMAAEALEHATGQSAKGVVALISKLVLDTIGQVMHGDISAIDEGMFDRAFGVVAAAWAAGDEEARGAIVDVLFRLDGDRAVTFLDEVMNDPDPWLRIHVIELIAAIADRRAPEFIARFLGDDDDMVREVATETLRSRGFEQLSHEER